MKVLSTNSKGLPDKVSFTSDEFREMVHGAQAWDNRISYLAECDTAYLTERGTWRYFLNIRFTGGYEKRFFTDVELAANPVMSTNKMDILRASKVEYPDNQTLELRPGSWLNMLLQRSFNAAEISPDIPRDIFYRGREVEAYGPLRYATPIMASSYNDARRYLVFQHTKGYRVITLSAMPGDVSSEMMYCTDAYVDKLMAELKP